MKVLIQLSWFFKQQKKQYTIGIAMLVFVSLLQRPCDLRSFNLSFCNCREYVFLFCDFLFILLERIIFDLYFCCYLYDFISFFWIIVLSCLFYFFLIFIFRDFVTVLDYCFVVLICVFFNFYFYKCFYCCLANCYLVFYFFYYLFLITLATVLRFALFQSVLLSLQNVRLFVL